MRENPNEEQDPTLVDFAGDNFERYSGEVRQHAKLANFAWEAEQRGENIHVNANPTMGEILYKQFANKKSSFNTAQNKSILEKYGGGEHLDGIPAELLLAQSEHYVEYSQSGQIIKGLEKNIPKSKYPEDVYVTFLI